MESDKLVLIVADQDAGYTDRLAEYVRDSDWSRKVAIVRLSRTESLREVACERAADVCLIHAEFAEADVPPGCLLIRLCETRREVEAAAHGAPALYKYQPLPQLLTRIAELRRSFARPQPGDGAAFGEAAAVIAVFSAAGGVGKTTVSVRLAQAFSAQGGRALYWNMELVSGASFHRETDAELAARLLYGLRTDEGRTADRLQSLIARDETFGIDRLQGLGNVRETLEMSREDVALLLAALKRLRRYDAIVIDLESTLHARTLGALAESDAIVWLVAEDAESTAKTFRLLAGIDEMQDGADVVAPERIRFVVNKHTGSAAGGRLQPPEGFAGRSAPVAAVLPYVSKWKQVHGADARAREPVFNEQVAKLAAGLRAVWGRPS
jgi:MinD-like ATPase involved in chromosome partitioning or flagellar assembly